MKKIMFTADEATLALIETMVGPIYRSRSAVIAAAVHAFAARGGSMPTQTARPQPRPEKPKPRPVPDLDAMTDEEVMAFLTEADAFDPKEGVKDEDGNYHRYKIIRHTTDNPALEDHGKEYRAIFEEMCTIPTFPDRAGSSRTIPFSEVKSSLRQLFKDRFDKEQKALAEKESGA